MAFSSSVRPSAFDDSFIVRFQQLEQLQNVKEPEPVDLGLTCSCWEGGGILGIAYIGAVRAMEEVGALGPSMRCFAGTSAGSMVAAVLACRASGDYIERMFRKVDFNDFLDNSWGVLRDLYRLYTKHGWNKGNAFLDWFGGVMKDLTGSSETTLLQAHRRFGTTLKVFAWDKGHRRGVCFSHETYPDLPIKNAVRMSMSVPFLFQSCWLDIDGKRCEIVDGGIYNNYPIHAFDMARYCDDVEHNFRAKTANTIVESPVTGETMLVEAPVVNWETIGFRLDTQDDVDFSTKVWHDTSSIKDSAIETMNSVYTLSQRRVLHPVDQMRTVKIFVGSVDALNFSVSDDTKEELIRAGYDATQRYLSKMADFKRREAVEALYDQSTEEATTATSDETGGGGGDLHLQF